jgi:hypothetical protein
MSTPILLISGIAGSGKDSVAEHLVKTRGAVAVAQADILKRMVQELFGFSDTQLWGPSATRSEEIDVSGLRKTFNDCYIDIDVRTKYKEILGIDQYNQDLFDRCLDQILAKSTCSARKALQLFGTDWGRAVDDQIWTRQALDTAKKLLGGGYVYKNSIGLTEDDTTAPSLVIITDARFRSEIITAKTIGAKVLKIERPGLVCGTHKSETEVATIPKTFFDFIIRNDGSLSTLYDKSDFAVDQIFPTPREI